MKYLLLVITILTLNFDAKAEVYLEADPIAYGLNGHSVHLGYEGGGFRMQTGIFKAEFPDSYKDNDSFDVTQGGYGLKIDWYGRREDGFFLGFEFSKTKVTLALAGSEVKRDVDLAGIRFGYKIMLGRSWYLTPWIGIDKDISNSAGERKVQLNNEIYELREFTVFPTVHLGLEFF